jgi:hypothetical protein
MRERRSENGLLNDAQGYHSAWGELRLAEVTLEEGHPAVSRQELVSMKLAMIFNCIPGAQPVGKSTRECTFPRIFLPFYQKDMRFGEARCFIYREEWRCRKSNLPGWWYLKGMNTADYLGYLGSCVSKGRALRKQKSYQVDASQRYIRGSLRTCRMKNAIKGTHDASEAINACPQLLQHNDNIAIINIVRNLSGCII